MARLAQSVERKALNLVVVGSSPTVGVLPFPLGWRSFRCPVVFRWFSFLPYPFLFGGIPFFVVSPSVARVTV